jgi:hypothetical protein
VATIHAEVATSHEAASIAKQEDCGATVLFWAGETAKHVLFGPLLTTLRELNKQVLNHGSDNVAWGDSVDANVIGTPFGSEVASKLDNCGLASVVCGANKTLSK